MPSDVVGVTVKLRGQTSTGARRQSPRAKSGSILRHSSISVLANKRVTSTICKYGMDFRRLSGKLTRMTFVLGKRLSVLGLVVFGVAVVGEGCAPPCPAGTYGPYDNRDRTMFPTRNEDWVCVSVPESVPPPPAPVPPDLGEFKPADLPGPKDRDAVAKAAIFVESCIHEALSLDVNINSRIDSMYATVMKSTLERSIAEHVSCFKRKTNGCQAVQECLGIAIVPHEPAFATGCTNGVGLRRIVSQSGETRDLWLNCDDLGDLNCYALPEPWCGAPRGACTAPTCHMFEGCPINCQYSPADDKMLGYAEIRCWDYDLVCNDDGSEALCMGSGAACSISNATSNEYFADFRNGISCSDETQLLTCINGHEQPFDCSTLGKEFKCIGGSRPHCGVDFQCNYDGSNPLPTCNGSLLTVCNAGENITIDCVSLGFQGCDAQRGVCKPRDSEAQP